MEQRSSEQDREMVCAFIAGDDTAFVVLYEQYQPALVRLLTARLGDRATAEDVAQEVMIRAMRHRERVDPDRPLWPWLRRIAVNAAIDVTRARSRASAMTEALAATDPATVTHMGAEQVLVERDVLTRAMRDIPARQRSALERCYVEGWRPTDAAVDFGVGRNAFEQLLHRARGNLRRAYARHDGTDRAAGMAWLLLAATWAEGALDRVRRLSAGAGETAGQAVAASLVAATLAVGSPVATPPPGPQPDQPGVQSPVGEGDTALPAEAVGAAPVDDGAAAAAAEEEGVTAEAADAPAVELVEGDETIVDPGPPPPPEVPLPLPDGGADGAALGDPPDAPAERPEGDGGGSPEPVGDAVAPAVDSVSGALTSSG